MQRENTSATQVNSSQQVQPLQINLISRLTVWNALRLHGSRLGAHHLARATWESTLMYLFGATLADIAVAGAVAHTVIELNVWLDENS